MQHESTRRKKNLISIINVILGKAGRLSVVLPGRKRILVSQVAAQKAGEVKWLCLWSGRIERDGLIRRCVREGCGVVVWIGYGCGEGIVVSVVLSRRARYHTLWVKDIIGAFMNIGDLFRMWIVEQLDSRARRPAAVELTYLVRYLRDI